MTAALIAAFGVIAAVLALATYVVTLVRTAERERAAALVVAVTAQGERLLDAAKAKAEIDRLVDDVRRLQRRGDALEDYIRTDRIKRHGEVDDGTDLLLAELSIVAAGADDDPATVALAPGGDPSQGTVFADTSGSGPTSRRSLDGASDGALSETDTPSGRVPTDPVGGG